MDDVHGMEVCHPGSNILSKGHSLLPRQRLGRIMQQFSQSPSGNILSNQMQTPLFVKDANKPQHIVVVQTPQDGHL